MSRTDKPLRNQKAVRLLVYSFYLLVSLSGCATKQYRYVSDAPRDVAIPITNSYTSNIQLGDRLYIHVDASSPEAVLQFNEETNRQPANNKLGVRNTYKDMEPHGYTVSASGDIIMPVLGRLHAAGLTTQQLADTIAKHITDGGYVKDPYVTVNLMNFEVTVIGEVKVPRTLQPTSERFTIFEALSQCGDVTMYGIRTCVVIVRTENNIQTIDTVDLTSKEILNSPYYYLHNNDIVYVEPNEKRKRQAYRDNDWIRYTSTGVSTVRLAYTIIRYYISINQMNRN